MNLTTIKQTIRATALIALALLLNTCGKKIETVNKDYIGTWQYNFSGQSTIEQVTIKDGEKSEVNTCTVDNNNCINYINSTCYTCQSNADGHARIKGNKLHIGRIKYRIDQGPTYGTSGMYIILDGKTYLKTSSDGTCNDGVQNQNETGVDCGGVCGACATCYDGIKNQNETNIDCGGSCDSCFSSFNYSVSSVFGGGTSANIAKMIDVSYSGGIFTIKASSDSLNYNLFLTFNASGTGTYNFTSTTYVIANSVSDKFYWTSGSIHITALDLSTKKISATFSFTGYNAATLAPIKYCSVSNGSFTNVKYHN